MTNSKVISEYFKDRESVVFPYLLLFGAPAVASLAGLALIMGLLAGVRYFAQDSIPENFTLSLGIAWSQIGASFLAIVGFGTLLFFSLWRGDAGLARISARYWADRERRLVTTLEAFVRLVPFYWGAYLVSVIGFALLALFFTSLGLWQPVIFAGALLLSSLFLSGVHLLRYLLFTGQKSEEASVATAQEDAAATPVKQARASWLLRGLAVVLKSRPGRLIVGVGLLPALILGAVLLPVAVGVDALLDFSPQRIGRQGGALRVPGRAEITFPAEGVRRPFWAQSEAIARSAFLEGSMGPDLLVAAENIPPFLMMKSSFYRLHYKGAAPATVDLTINIPRDAQPHRLLDLYTWNGQDWRWLPSRKNVTAGTIETTLTDLPHTVVVMQAAAAPPQISTIYSPDDPLGRNAQETLTEIYPQGFQLDHNGNLTGRAADITPEFVIPSLAVIPTLRNWDDESGLQTGLPDQLLVDQRLRERHIEAIIDLVQQNRYQGVDLDYRGLKPHLRQAYTDFLTQLRAALPADKQLVVHVEFPDKVSEATWETGAYDWTAIGRIADVVKIPPAPRPDLYGPGKQMETLLDWAVDHVNRFKLQPILRTNSLELVDDVARSITLQEAFAPLEETTIVLDADNVEPGQVVDLTLASPESPVTIQFDRAGEYYRFIYNDDNGRRRLIYVENAATISNKLQFLARYHLRGVVLENLLDAEADSPLWEVARKFPGLVVPPLKSEYGVMWRIRNQQGEVIDQTILNLSDSAYTWTAADSDGVYDIEAAIVSGRDQAEIASVDNRSLMVKGSAFRSTPAATPAPGISPTLLLPLTFPPTATPEPTPVLQPAPEPTPTVSQTQTPVAVGGCPEPPQGEFARLWQANHEAFGCPIETGPLSGVFVEMSFEHGRLVWMKDIERYGDVSLAIAAVGGQNEGDTGTWLLQTENWQGEGVCPVGPPPEGLYLPDRNLAQVWCDMNGLERLGYATTPQEIVADGGQAALQNFENVIILKDSLGEAQGLAYVLFRADNTYRRMVY